MANELLLYFNQLILLEIQTLVSYFLCFGLRSVKKSTTSNWRGLSMQIWAIDFIAWLCASICWIDKIKWFIWAILQPTDYILKNSADQKEVLVPLCAQLGLDISDKLTLILVFHGLLLWCTLEVAYQKLKNSLIVSYNSLVGTFIPLGLLSWSLLILIRVRLQNYRHCFIEIFRCQVAQVLLLLRKLIHYLAQNKFVFPQNLLLVSGVQQQVLLTFFLFLLPLLHWIHYPNFDEFESFAHLVS